MKTRILEPTIAMIGLTVCYSFIAFLGQVSEATGTENMEWIGTIIGQIGVVGVLVWYLYHTTTKTLPDLEDRHSKTIEDITKTHSDTIKEISDKFDGTLKEERTTRKLELKSLQEWIKYEAACRYNQACVKQEPIQLPELPNIEDKYGKQ